MPGLVIVNHFHDGDGRNLVGVDATVVSSGHRVVSRFKDQPKRVNKVHSELTASPASQLVSPIGWTGGNHGECSRVLENGESDLNRPRHTVPVFLDKGVLGVERLAELPGAEGDVQVGIPISLPKR